MAVCNQCGQDIPDNSGYCLHCGIAQDLSRFATINVRTPPLPTSGSDDGTRFVPGSIIENRYRIVGMLGKGGMGEVYRADDLKLGQPVALKFLRARHLREEESIARLRREVAIARQIAHPNVCRVFDIVEAEGSQFLTMEFIDGEDLGSLLRRIGRLPYDKGVQIAQHLCAGLSAAHEAGILHRDLKPANIMLDGRGRARITDFGLARIEQESQPAGAVEGTAVYMAPELFTGGEPTVRSDLYALGLVLYEIFTGKRLFDAKTIPELMQQHQETIPTIPESIGRDIDPAVESVMLRCLHRDPAQRPGSALQVSAALPGSDPLAAALAAGETPSPELVAAAAKEGAIPLKTGALLFGIILMELIALFIASKDRLINRLMMNKPPAVLVDRAQGLVQKFGYSEPPADAAWGFHQDRETLEYLKKQGEPLYTKIETGQPRTFYFWYRQSPHSLTPSESTVVTWVDPPVILPGMVNIALDPLGRLIEFQGVPTSRGAEPSAHSGSFDWGSVWTEAGIDITQFSETQPKWIPPSYADQRRAWGGSYPDHPEIGIRIEAASYDDSLVMFQVVPPWKVPAVEEPITTDPDQSPQNKSQRRALMIGTAVYFTSILVAILLARKNLRLGRGDRKGAFRVALFMFLLVCFGNILKGHHAMARRVEINIFFQALESGLRASAFLWVYYIALEPYVRRLRPELLISWTRLLSGDIKNPMVGRDILLGGLFAPTMGVLNIFYFSLIEPGLTGTTLNPSTLLGLPAAVGVFLDDILATGIGYGMFVLMLFLLSYVVFRRHIFSVTVIWVSMVVMSIAGGVPWLPACIFAALMALTVVRLGLLASISFYTFLLLLSSTPIASDLSRWYTPTGGVFLASMVLLLAFSFRIAVGGKPLLPDPLASIHLL